MCSDPDSLGAAIICQYLMTNKKRNDKEFTYGSALTLVQERRSQVDLNLQLTETLQKYAINDQLKVAISKRISVKQKPEEKSYVTRQD